MADRGFFVHYSTRKHSTIEWRLFGSLCLHKGGYDMANLDVELKTYQQMLPSLLGQIGKYAVIKGQSVAGVYDSYEDALKFGYDKFKLEPFLVKRIAPAEQVSYFTRDFAHACPA